MPQVQRVRNAADVARYGCTQQSSRGLIAGPGRKPAAMTSAAPRVGSKSCSAREGRGIAEDNASQRYAGQACPTQTGRQHGSGKTPARATILRRRGSLRCPIPRRGLGARRMPKVR